MAMKKKRSNRVKPVKNENDWRTSHSYKDVYDMNLLELCEFLKKKYKAFRYEATAEAVLRLIHYCETKKLPNSIKEREGEEQNVRESNIRIARIKPTRLHSSREVRSRTSHETKTGEPSSTERSIRKIKWRSKRNSTLDS